MFKKIVVLSIILSIHSTMLGGAQPQDLLSVVDQYYNNTNRLTDLNLNKTYLEKSTSDLNKSLIKLEVQIKNFGDNIKLYRSEITTLETNIQEYKNKKNEIEQSIQLLNILDNKESIILLGTLIGTIAGLWIVSLALVLLWRR